MTQYFKNCKTLDELKVEYRKLAMQHHPDRGGDLETMKAINVEYDILFPTLKKLYNATAEKPTTETAESTRSEFYTQNGWKGSNYRANLTLKEIAQIVRTYVKTNYPDYKFSVRTSYASMCQELHVDLKESPVEIYKTFAELTNDDKSDLIRKANRNGVFSLTCWNDAELKAEFERIWQKHGNFYKCLNEKTKAVIEDVDALVNSYNYSDCDGMIDYFDVNFYYFGCAQNNGEYITVVPKAPKIKAPKKAEAAKDEPQKSGDVLRVEINAEFNGIEVYFPGKPSAEIRTELKANGWRWHNKKQCWYNKNTENNLQNLRRIAG